MPENKKFYLRVPGKRVLVSEEVYREYYKMYRRERYLEEQDEKNGKFSYNAYDTDEIPGEDILIDVDAENLEDIVIRKIMTEKLIHCLKLLTEAEREIIEAIYYTDMTERDYSKKSQIPQMTINDRKNRLLDKLKKLLEK